MYLQFKRYSVHGIGYTFCLVVSGFHIYRVHNSIYFALGVITVFMTRITYGVSKYTLWTTFAFVAALPELMEMAQQNKVPQMVDSYGMVPFNVTESFGLGQQYLATGAEYLNAVSA